MAFSGPGASSFASYLSVPPSADGSGRTSNYLDVGLESWCRVRGGFRVYMFEHVGQEVGHRGGFYQDRNSYVSGIGERWKSERKRL